jgi:hypothetical protein
MLFSRKNFGRFKAGGKDLAEDSGTEGAIDF